MKRIHSVLNLFYEAECNLQISCFWDSGWSFKIGDELNGFTYEDSGYSLEQMAQVLHEFYQVHVAPRLTKH